MSKGTTGLWLAAVAAAGAIGWYAALQVERGPAFKNEQDAYERFANAMTINDSMGRTETMVRLVRRLTPETLPGAIRAYKGDMQDVFNNDLRVLMWYWGKQDPRGMLGEMQGWSEVRAQRMAAGEAVYWVLKQEGYDGAKVLFDQLPNHLRDAALPQLVLAYLESGATPNLIGLIETYQIREEREMVASIIVGQILFLNGPEALASWVESLPDGGGAQSGLKSVAFRAAQTELMRREELAFLESWIDRVDQEWWAKGARRAIAVNIAKRDPIRAIEWVEKLEPEQGREEIYGETLRTFASFDRAGALAWIRARNPEARLDPGAARVSYEFALRDPAVALEMAKRVQDPAMRANLAKSLRAEWRAIPEPERARVLEELDAISQPEPADDPKA